MHTGYRCSFSSGLTASGTLHFLFWQMADNMRCEHSSPCCMSAIHICFYVSDLKPQGAPPPLPTPSPCVKNVLGISSSGLVAVHVVLLTVWCPQASVPGIPVPHPPSAQTISNCMQLSVAGQLLCPGAFAVFRQVPGLMSLRFDARPFTCVMKMHTTCMKSGSDFWHID